MQVGQFPAAAANSLIQGYCDDFVSLASILAQTLEQVSMRGLNFDGSRPALQRIESGMRNLADAIQDLLARGKVTTDLTAAKNKEAGPMPATAPTLASPSAPPAPPAPPRAAAAAPAPSAQPAVARSRAIDAPGAAPALDGGARPGAPRAPAARPAAAAPSPAHAAAGATAPAARSHAQAAMRPSSGATTALRPAPQRPKSEGIKGTSQSMPLLSVFQFLGRMRKSGLMHVALDGEELAFALQQGCVTSTVSTRCPRAESLAELLVELEFSTRELLEPIAKAFDPDYGTAFAEQAIAGGLVTEPRVVAALQLQGNRRYTRACKSPDARYEFLEDAAVPEPRFRTPPMPLA